MAEPLSDSGNPRIVQGGNSPPPDAFKESAEFKALLKEIQDLYGEAKNFADGVPIDSEPMHAEVTRLAESLKAAGAKANAMRVELNKPFDEGKKVVQATFNTLIGDTKTDGKGLVTLATESLGTLLTAWRLEQQRIKDAAAKLAQEEAAALTAAATAAVRESAGDLEAREDAEHQLRDAAKATKAAGKAARAAVTGTGLRRAWGARVTDLNKALSHYYQKGESPHRAKFEALVLELANADVRAGARDGDAPAIPGIVIEQEATAK